MHVSIDLNPKHESDRLTAFYESLATSGHAVNLVFENTDLIDPEKEPSLENLGVKPYWLRLSNSVVYRDRKGRSIELHRRLNNVLQRKSEA